MKRIGLWMALGALVLCASCGTIGSQWTYLTEEAKVYTVKKVDPANPPCFDCRWWSPVWEKAETQGIKFFTAKSKIKDVIVQFRLLHDEKYIYGIAYTNDRYVSAVYTYPNEMPCRDNCFEAFLMPSDKGYVNMEISIAGGILGEFHPRPKGGKDNEYWPGERMSAEFVGKTFQAKTSLPGPVNPECESTLVWVIEFRFPVSIYKRFMENPEAALSGQVWRGNFFHCAGHSSHPRWAAWSPLGAFGGFHDPSHFATVKFE